MFSTNSILLEYRRTLFINNRVQEYLVISMFVLLNIFFVVLTKAILFYDMIYVK